MGVVCPRKAPQGLAQSHKVLCGREFPFFLVSGDLSYFTSELEEFVFLQLIGWTTQLTQFGVG